MLMAEGRIVSVQHPWFPFFAEGSYCGLTNQLMLIVLNRFYFCCGNAALHLSAGGELKGAPALSFPPPDPLLVKGDHAGRGGTGKKGGADRI